MRYLVLKRLWFFLALSLLFSGATVALHANNRILGRVHFIAANKAARSSGVWVDGQYVGYLGELKGSRKVLLLPGRHTIAVKQAGFFTVRRSVNIQPGKKVDFGVAMLRNPKIPYPKVFSQIKLNVQPNRAAVFLDGDFVGYAGEFGGMGKGMLLSPGKHRIEIDLPGYRGFATTVNLLPRQKMVLETKLVKGSIQQADPLIRKSH